MIDDSHIAGCILGTAVADSLGLPYEGISRRRLLHFPGPPDRHRFLFGYGMISDDTEHTCLVAQALIASGTDRAAFIRDLGRRFRWWFASLPAGLGRATLRSCVKLWFGVSPERSGVYSAGNGPAMRAALLGVWFDDLEVMATYVRSSSRITHSDPKAEFGALAVALAAFMGCRENSVDGHRFLEQLKMFIGSEGNELVLLLESAVQSVSTGESTLEFAGSIGCGLGVSGYTYHAVPVAIHSWLSHPRDYALAVSSVIECGGDADTTAAIVGGIVGATTGESGIPDLWLSRLFDWPRSVNWMRRLADQLAKSRIDQRPMRPVKVSLIACLVRNLVFLIVVLFHGFRRFFPPY